MKKIINEINKVKNSNSNKIEPGNFNVSRDWDGHLNCKIYLQDFNLNPMIL